VHERSAVRSGEIVKLYGQLRILEDAVS
jgi:hypothetical protein